MFDLPDDRRPLTVRIAEAITTDIRRGRLAPGAGLPGSRKLARTLGVHRNTVVAAYSELQSQGLLEARSGGGTYVARSLPWRAPTPGAAPRGLGFDLPPEPDFVEADPLPDAPLRFASLPDPRDMPWELLARAYRRVLRRNAAGLLGYSDPRGDVALRTAVAELLRAERGLAVEGDAVQITRGSQMASYLVSCALIRPGDKVAVETLGYRSAWDALRAAGAELIPIEVDAGGMRVDRLAEVEGLRAIYVTPHHQYPTTVTLAPERRTELLALCRARRIVLIEDDYDNEFHYDGRPRLPLASTDEAGCVVYLGTLSKILAPGLRIGFVSAAPQVLQRLARWRRVIDRQGDSLGERAVAELFADQEVQRHARRMRRRYHRRRDCLAEALTRRLPQLRFRLPEGGMAIWVEGDMDFEAWAERALGEGVAFAPGAAFSFRAQPCGGARLGFATLDEADIEEAVRALAASL